MITAYPVAGKPKATDICRAFIQGCGGSIAHGVSELMPGDAFFYGVDASNVHLYRAAKKDMKRNWYYCDNSYFDSTRQEYFRVTRNRLQHSGLGQSSGYRFRQLGITIKPWREKGNHIVVCPQSVDFMANVAEFQGNWTDEIVGALASFTKRPIRVRLWNRDKGKLAASLADDLMDAHALVTWSSAAAITAVLAGVPVVCMSYHCAAGPMAGKIYGLEKLPMPNNREEWAGVLADNQWTLEEFKSGYAWNALTGEG